MPDINVNKLSEALNTKADIDLNNTGVFSTSEGGGVNLTSSTPNNASGKEVTSADFIKSGIQSNLLNYTTNRILEIPQEIKWRTDLVETDKKRYRLTILKGSIYYVPQGFEADGVTRKFSKRTMIADNTCGDGFWSDNVLYEEFVFLIFKDNKVLLSSTARAGSNITSGDTAPTTFLEKRALWYDTKNNYVKFTEDSGTTWYNCSLPLLKGSPRNTIDETHPIAGWVNGPTQVFNGFGYIGSTVFALPGVKGLIPNGRNADGSLKNIEARTDSVITYTNINKGNRWYSFKSPVNGIWTAIDYKTDNSLSIGTQSKSWFFDENANYWMFNGNKSYNWLDFAHSNIGTDRPFAITSFTPRNVDSIANSNASNFSQVGRSYLSGLGMPSSRYIDLTLGASGTTYTAPANGWFSLDTWTTSTATAYYHLYNSTSKLALLAVPNQGHGYQQKGFIPCKAGDIVAFIYANIDTTKTKWCFIYAQGEQ